MQLLIRLVGGLVQLPDKSEYFKNQDRVEIDGELYLFCTYSGSKSLASDYDVQTYLSSLNESPLLPIVIDSVTGALDGFDDAPNMFTVSEGVNVIARGKLAIPDQKFRVPFERVDTGRVQPMVAEVVNSEFTLTMNFRTGGKWVVNDKLLNSELPTPMFSIKQHTFMVV